MISTPEDQPVKKCLPFELICAVLIVNLNRYPLVTQCISWTALICSVPLDPSRQKMASIWAYMCSILEVHSNHSLCPSTPKFTDLICSVHQDPSRQKVASIWADMYSILRVHSNHSLWRPYPSVLTLYVQYTKTLAVKKWLPFELICAAYMCSSLCSNLVQIWIWQKIKCTPPSLALFGWAGCIIKKKSKAGDQHEYLGIQTKWPTYIVCIFICSFSLIKVYFDICFYIGWAYEYFWIFIAY